VQLTLIKQTSPPQSPTSPPLYSQKALDDIKEILQNTTLRGTAKKARIKGYTIMSKTGTTNLLINGSYAQNKNAYTCAGIIKKDDYQRVIIAYVKQGNRGGLFGSSVAAPLFERIAEKTIIHDKIV
jgi:cell division protein FtsI (penicillin-binding protein 3)